MPDVNVYELFMIPVKSVHDLPAPGHMADLWVSAPVPAGARPCIASLPAPAPAGTVLCCSVLVGPDGDKIVGQTAWYHARPEAMGAAIENLAGKDLSGIRIVHGILLQDIPDGKTDAAGGSGIPDRLSSEIAMFYRHPDLYPFLIAHAVIAEFEIQDQEPDGRETCRQVIRLSRRANDLCFQDDDARFTLYDYVEAAANNAAGLSPADLLDMPDAEFVLVLRDLAEHKRDLYSE